MNKYLKQKAIISFSLMMFALCQTVRADLGTLIEQPYPGADAPASGFGTNWLQDPNGNHPFYSSVDVTTNISNYFTSVGEPAINLSIGDANVIGEVVCISNTCGVSVGNGLAVNSFDPDGTVSSTNYVLTGVALLINNNPDTTHPYSLHIYDVTTNLTGNAPIVIGEAGLGYNFVSNGDLLGGGTNGVPFTNTAAWTSAQNPFPGEMSVDASEVYIGLSNGYTHDRIVLGSNHVYAVEVDVLNGAVALGAAKSSPTAGFNHTVDPGGNLMVSSSDSLTQPRETGSAAGDYGSSIHTWAIALYGYPTNAPATVNSSTNTLPPPPLPPVVASIQAAKTPELRIFAASAGTVYDREELATLDNGQSWIGGTYPVSYSFKLLDYPANIGQSQIFLVPSASAGAGATLGNAYTPGSPPTPNEYIEYQASNDLWMVFGPGPNNTVIASVAWKTNLPNANPNNTVLTITNSTAVGTWTLTFTDPDDGTLTAPGASPAPFTIGDPTVSTDFANPLVAYFGLQPNGAAGEGEYEDWASITVSGVSGANENEDFTKETSDNLYANGNWQVNAATAAVAETGVEIISTNDFPAYWVNYTLPAPNFLIGENTNLTETNWINPTYYDGYNNETAPIGVAAQMGQKMWVYLPWEYLPTADNGQNETISTLSPKAYFLATTNQLSPGSAPAP